MILSIPGATPQSTITVTFFSFANASNSKEFREDLVTLAISNEMPFSSRAAGALLSLSEQNSELVVPYIKAILNNLNSIENHTQISSLLRLFDALPSDLDEWGSVVRFLYSYAAHPSGTRILKSHCDEHPGKIRKSLP